MLDEHNICGKEKKKKAPVRAGEGRLWEKFSYWWKDKITFHDRRTVGTGCYKDRSKAVDFRPHTGLFSLGGDMDMDGANEASGAWYKGIIKKALAELGCKGGTRSKTERNQWIAAEKECAKEVAKLEQIISGSKTE